MGAPKILREALMLDGPAGRLEALLEQPREASGRAVAVLCHPHPQFQGTMLNKVVHTLARVSNELGAPALRFNFRGVGASDGDFAGGLGEAEDTVAVANWARQRYPGAERMAGLLDAQQPACRWLILQGDADEVVNCDAVVDWVNRLEPGPELRLLPGVDHFFHGKLVELRETVVKFVDEQKAAEL